MTIKIKQKFKRIITHSGRFHADEVFAIAFLLFHNLVETDYEIIRLNNYDNFNKKNTDIVIDIGGKLDSKNNIYDHHYANDIGHSTCVLILNKFMKDKRLRRFIYDSLFKSISEADTGKNKTQNASLSLLISLINNLENNAFQTAITQALFIYEVYYINGIKTIQDEIELLNNISNTSTVYYINEQNKEYANWKRLLKKSNIKFMIYKHQRNKKGFCVKHVDSLPLKGKKLAENIDNIICFDTIEESIDFCNKFKN